MDEIPPDYLKSLDVVGVYSVVVVGDSTSGLADQTGVFCFVQVFGNFLFLSSPKRFIVVYFLHCFFLLSALNVELL